jgi:hypothetical protein
MNIEDVKNEIPDMDDMIRSAHRFAAIVVGATIFVAVIGGFLHYTFFADIVYKVQLIQAILIGSTALMGLTGLMMLEMKRTNVTGLSSENMLVKIKAMNTITSLARAFVFLQWVMLLSIFSIIFSGLFLMFNNTVLIICSIAAFFDQIYLFIWGLMFSDFLPS